MSSSYKPRGSDEALAEQLSLARNRTGTGSGALATPTYRHISGAMATLPRHDNNHQSHNADNSARLRTDSTATSRTCVYIGGEPAGGAGTASGTGNGHISVTLDRRQPQRMSWLNMRRAKANEADPPAVTPSPQTTRSCISTVSSVVDSGGGRTTATSGRISSSGIVTLSGSNNTLSEIQGGYHDLEHDAVSKNYSVSASVHNITTASNAKLLPAVEDESNQQVSALRNQGEVFVGFMVGKRKTKLQIGLIGK